MFGGRGRLGFLRAAEVEFRLGNYEERKVLALKSASAFLCS